MPSLLVVVFVLQLAIHLINTVGVNTVNSLLWNIYNRLPTPTSKDAIKQRQLQGEFLRLKQELNKTSAQDEFAKWAKLDRQFNKVMEQLEKTKGSLDTTKATFDKAVSALRWIGTNGLRMFLQFWFSKQPMFWLPQGWVPYYGEWLLSFPRAPLGSISIQAWAIACAAVILLVSDAITAAIALVFTAKAGPAQKNQEPMKSGEKPAVVPGKVGSKKEL